METAGTIAPMSTAPAGRPPLDSVLRGCRATQPGVRDRAARQLRQVVRGMVFRHVDGRREELEELAQDRMAWLFAGGIDKLLDKRRQMDDPRRFASYFRRTIVRAAREPFRRHRHSREFPLRVLDSRSGDPADRIADDMITFTRLLGHRRAFWQAFDDLPAADRHVLGLELAHCLGDIDRADMLRELGLNTDLALRSRICRAKARFKVLLGERGLDVDQVHRGDEARD
jgi:hypothetical protein